MTFVGDIVAGAHCRSCRAVGLRLVLDLGEMPLVACFVRPGEEDGEQTYPLKAIWCGTCSLLQLENGPGPDTLFDNDYPYYSSVSASYVRHAQTFADKMISEYGLKHDSMVLEIASNDGYLLRNFVEKGIPVLGIDPAEGPAARANSQGVKTMNAFFTSAMAAELAADGVSADLIAANNVLAHVPDPNDLVRGVAALLTPGGCATFEVPYVLDLVEKKAFDTIYHEHHCYFSMTALVALFERWGLSVSDVERVPVHGGSLRVYVKKRNTGRSGAVDGMLAGETHEGVVGGQFLDGFSAAVDSTCQAIRKTIVKLRNEGADIAAYGAAAKGVVLLNSASIGSGLVKFVADLNPAKHGRLIPGVHIPICRTEEIVLRMPDYVLLLAWNFAEEIIAQQTDYLAKGGCFIVPIPEVRFVRSS